MQQIKSENLELVNVAKPEDNFAKNLRHENKEYKSGVFDKKTWEVSLLPHEKYTWVFSSNQDYNPANFKNWGFKWWSFIIDLKSYNLNFIKITKILNFIYSTKSFLFMMAKLSESTNSKKRTFYWLPFLFLLISFFQT